MASRMPATMTLKPTERQIQEACSDFLALDGWRPLKTDPVSRREWGKGFGEKGMADMLYLRYENYGLPLATAATEAGATPTECRSIAQVLWIEYKRRTGKVAAAQHAWHQAERARGALTLIAGIDFAASTQGFMDWYFQSGLARQVRDKRK